MTVVLADQATLAVTPAFVDRIRIYLVDYSIGVLDDTIDDTPITVASHALRVALARRILANPLGYGEILAYALVADGTLTGASDDAAIKTQVGTLYTDLATLI